MVKVAERGGFTAVAAEVGLTPSAVAKLVTRLEQRLGVRLLHRTTRRVTLTDEGERYVSQARSILAEIEAFEADLTAQGATPRGLIRVACGTSVGVDILLQALPDFRSRYPEIELDFVLSDRRVDLVDEQIDVALRLGDLLDSSLVARHICTFRRVICAAPSYLRNVAPVVTPDDLLTHECLNITAVPNLRLWPFKAGKGTRIIEVRGRIQFNMASAVLAAGIAGLGIMRVSDVMVGTAIERGCLVPLLMQDHLSQPIQLTALMPRGRQHTPKIRAFLSFLSTTFAVAVRRVPTMDFSDATQ
jgi:DNA-binding transcriptional LysR family regulator